jgi:oxalate decarboxylase/phosphoglucose isomerase-like protein (cupin superfamily)
MDDVEFWELTPAYEDERGKIFDLIDGDVVRHIGLITCTAGAVRGNHYHEEQKQWMYVSEGEISLYLQDVRGENDGDVQEYEMEEGEMVFIPPGVVHTIEATQYAEFYDFNDKERGEDGELYEEDTVRVDDITE